MAAIAAAGLAGLTGCAGESRYVVRSETAVQAGALGDVVRVEATFCDAGSTAGCGPAGTAVTGAGARLPARVRASGLQVFAGFLVPQGAGVPATAQAVPPDGLAATTLLRRPEVDDDLQRLRPAPEGQRWVAYRSAPIAVPDDARGGGDWSVEGAFTIPRGDGGLPVPASFAHGVMGAARLASAPNTRPLDCLASDTVCTAPSVGGELLLADLRGAGGSVTGEPGTRVIVPFVLRSVGPGGAPVTLRATTTVAGAVAASPAATLTPAGGGFVDIPVTVDVPAGASDGDYDVQLTGSVGGDVRRWTGTLTISGRQPWRPGAQAERPVLGASIGPQPPPVGRRLVELRAKRHATLAANATSVVVGEVRCHKRFDPCGFVSVHLVVASGQLAHRATIAKRVRTVNLGSVTLDVPAGGRRGVRVPLAPGVRGLLRSGRMLAAEIVLRAGRGAPTMAEPVTLAAR